MYAPQTPQRGSIPPGQSPFPNPQGAAPGSQSGAPHDAFSPLFAGDFGQNPLAQMGLAVGQRWAVDAKNRYQEGITKYLESTNLKYYFNINNSYVPNKLRILLCPILHKSWKRRIVQSPDGSEAVVYPPPKDDVNAPDLYIPIMAFITYVLVVGFCFGTKNEFTPEILGKVASTGLISLCIEVVFLKFGFYLLNSVEVSVWDLIAYSGYIFVGLVVDHLAGLIGGSYAYYATTFVTSIFMAIFMVKTLRLLVLPDQGNSVVSNSLPSNRRNYFLLSVALLQMIMAYFLGFY